MSTLTIRNGRVIDPATNTDQTTDLQIEAGCIKKVGKVARPTGTVLDAKGLIVCPGLIDPHVHLREPGQEDKETIATGSASAVNGGFTSIVCMPNTSPALDDDARIEYVYRQAARADLCNVYPTGAVTKGRGGKDLAEIGLMARAGAVGFTDDGDAIADAGVMSKALAYVKSTGKVLMQHCEEPTLIGEGVMNSGTLALKLGLAGRPAVAEELIIQRDITLNRAIGCRYHVQHMSTEVGVDLVRRARKQGLPVTAEVCPHHLLLTEDACVDYNTNYKMNPPLRTRRDIKALLKGVKDDTITVLGTDHAPHTREEKEREFADAPSGIIGLDCALALFAKALIDTDTCDWPQLIRLMTLAPAELCDLHDRGRLFEGGPADVTLIDPEYDWTIDINDFASKARNSPFHGWQVSARPVATLVGGQFKMNRLEDRLTKK